MAIHEPYGLKTLHLCQDIQNAHNLVKHLQLPLALKFDKTLMLFFIFNTGMEIWFRIILVHF